jgi:membrane associated rhomboid family serine protease
MLPLRAVDKPPKPPFVTRLIVVINVAAFAYQLLLTLWGGRDQFMYAMGVRPHCYFSPGSCGISVPGESELLWQPLLVSLFLHAGFLHLAFNMLFLWVFGPQVEGRLGKLRFALFYLGCGVAATLAHVVTHPFSPVPVIGASGAIAGVLGAYLILLPRSWILTYFPPIFLFPVPSPVFLIVWIASQITSAFTHLPGLSASSGTDIAWMSHVGGFIAGAAYAWSIKPWWKRRADRVRR